MNIIDFHCDTLTMLKPEEESFEKNSHMVDLERWNRRGFGCSAARRLCPPACFRRR